MKTVITSVIIVNYNTFDLTCQCIQSIYQKEDTTKLEIILVDNASTECEVNLFSERFPEIKFIKSATNVGFAKGNNLGIREAKGKYVLLLNSDTKLQNNAITLASRAMDKDENIGVLSGQLQYPNGDLQTVAGKFPSIKNEVRELLRLNSKLDTTQRAKYYLGTEWNYTQPTEADWVWGAFFIFRKEDLRQFPNGLLHDTFFMYGEDVQWCYHFKKMLGKQIIYDPSPKTVHYIGGSDKNKAAPFDRYKQKMLPHEYQWLCMIKGVCYTKLYYLIKSLVLFSLRKKEDIKKGKLFLKVALKGVDYLRN